MTREESIARKQKSDANKVKFLFNRIVKDLADLYDKGGMRLGVLWVPKAILNEMSKATIKRLDGMTLPGISGITRTRYGQLRILPLDSDKFHGAEFHRL